MVFYYKKIIGTLLLLLAVTCFASAQTLEPEETLATEQSTLQQELPPLYSESDIIFRITPENPGPFTPVTATLSSNLINVTQYPITWSVNDVVSTQGVGMRSFQTRTKDYGQPVTVTATIEHPIGDIVKTITLIPSDIPLTWEAIDAYAPPFYQGKKLAPREGTVTVIALPGSSSQGATYRWSRNGTVVPTASGYEKNTFSLKHNRVRATESIALVTTDGTGATSEKKITLNFIEPFVLFYEQNTQTGSRSPVATNRINLVRPNTLIEAVPYFFSQTTSLLNRLEFAWSMNNNPISSSSTTPWLLFITKPEGSGTAFINLRITNPGFILQTASTSAQILF